MADDLTTGQTVDVMIRVTAPNAQAVGQQVTQTIRGVTAAAKEGGTALPSFYEGVEQAGLRAGGAERGIRRMEFALSSVAAAALFSKNANETLADSMLRVGEAALLFAGGSPTALAFGAGLASFAVPFRALTQPLQEANQEAGKLEQTLNRIAAEGRPIVAQQAQWNALLADFAATRERLLRPGGFVGDVARAVGAVVPWRTQAEEFLDAAQITEMANEATERTAGAQLARDRPTRTAQDAVRLYGTLIRRQGEQGNIAGAIGELSNAQMALQQIVGLDPGTLREAMGQLATTLAQSAATVIRNAGQQLRLDNVTRDRTTRVLGLLGLSPEDVTAAQGIVNAAYIQASAAIQGGVGPLPTRIQLAPFVAPTAPFAGGPSPFGSRVSTSLMSGIATPRPISLSAVGDLQAHNAAERDAANRDIKINKAADTFGLALTASVGRAIVAVAGRRGGAAGLFTGASDILSTFASQRDATSGELLHPGLALPATILSVAGGLFSGILSNLFSSGISIKDYGPQALAQLRSVMVAGGIMSFNVTNSGGRSVPDIQNQIARNQSRDSIPRFPQQPPGAGR